MNSSVKALTVLAFIAGTGWLVSQQWFGSACMTALAAIFVAMEWFSAEIIDAIKGRQSI